MYVMMKRLMCVSVVTATLTATGALHAQSVNGVLRVVKGDVQIKSGKNGETTKAKLGQQVYPKDVILTGKDARAKIVMVDKNEINVSPESQIEIQHYEFDPAAGKKEVLLNVIYGKVRAKVEQKYDGKTSKFQVKTPAAVAGVRGTDFMTSFDRQTNSSQIITFRGKVEFGLPGPGNTIVNPVFVTPGTTASSTAGVAPRAATSVPKDQLAKMDNDTKADGTTAKGDTKSDRTPASDDKKKGAGPNAGDSKHSMLDAGADCATCGTAAPAPPAPVTGPPPMPKGPDVQPVCETCKTLIQNPGPTKVNITIKK